MSNFNDMNNDNITKMDMENNNNNIDIKEVAQGLTNSLYYLGQLGDS